MIANILILNPPLFVLQFELLAIATHFSQTHLTKLPITFAPGHQSIVDIQCFLIDTDYNWLPINIHPRSFGETAPMPQVIPLDHVFYIKGYFSKKQPGCFVWEEGHF